MMTKYQSSPRCIQTFYRRLTGVVKSRHLDLYFKVLNGYGV